MGNRTRLALLLACLLALACTPPASPDGGTPEDAGMPDAGSNDAGIPLEDAGLPVARLHVSRADAGPTLPEDFVGLSVELGAGERGYFGEGTQLNQTFVQLIEQLSPHGVFRIGGNSTDHTCFSASGKTSGLFCQVAFTPSDAEAIFAVSEQTGWSVLLGLNLGIDDAGVALAEARGAVLPFLDAGTLLGVEIGNEPDGYSTHVIGTLPDGGPIYARPNDGSWTLAAEESEFNDYVDAFRANPQVKNLPLVGPAFDGPSWEGMLADFARAVRQGDARRLSLATFHDYSTTTCHGASTSLAALLGPAAQQQDAKKFRICAEAGRDAGISVRLGEANSTACGGLSGVSDVAGSAMWGVDFMLSAAQAGLTGVNLHGGFSGPYTPIEVHNWPDGGIRSTQPRPLFYALYLVGQEAQGRHFVDARLTGLDGGVLPANVRTYALESCAATGCSLRVFLINKDGDASGAIGITADGASTTAELLTLSAASLADDGGTLFLGGARLNATGHWTPGAPQRQVLASDREGTFWVPLPTASVSVLELSR